MVVDEEARRRLSDRFGAAAGPWCDALPAMVERYRRRWDLELERAAPGGSSRVLAGHRGDGRAVVLKLTPDPALAVQEAAGLRIWAATAEVMNLLDADLDEGVLLLEAVVPGVPVSALRRLPFVQIAGLLTAPPPSRRPSLNHGRAATPCRAGRVPLRPLGAPPP